MSSLLLITNLERVQQLFGALEREGLFRLRVAPTLAQGEEEIVLHPPDLVFVQDHISGLSGALVVRYLRGLVPEQAEVVLMVQEPAAAAQARQDSLPVLDLGLSELQLHDAIADLLPARVEQPEPPSAEPAPPLPNSAKELIFMANGRPRGSRLDRGLIWSIALVLLVIALSGIAYFAGKRSGRKPPPPAASETPQPATSPGNQKVLPPFIAEGVADPGFSRSHPGWERYSFPDSEFRIYRENLAMKALQAQAAPGKVLLPSLLELALKETSGAAGYRVVSREQSAGYTVERGIGTGGSAVTLYRFPQGGGLQAFVLENPPLRAGHAFDLASSALPRLAPAQAAPAQAVPAAKPAPAGAGAQPAAPKEASSSASPGPGGGYRYYTVRKGDSLFRVLISDFGYSAAEAHSMIPEVLRLNGLRDAKQIKAGQKLKVPIQN